MLVFLFVGRRIGEMSEVSNQVGVNYAVLTPGVVEIVHRAALARYADEACGLLLGVRLSDGRLRVNRAIELPNVASKVDRRSRYEIDPRVLLEWERRAHREGTSIVGFFHSHPDHPPRPSATDAELAWPTYIYLIVGTAGRGDGHRDAFVSGMAAWTFEEASTSFRELKIDIEVGADEIEYYI